ncbi:MAG: glycosyltransferase family 87 protein [Blastocatellia bacterium]
MTRRLLIALAALVVLVSGVYFARQSGTNPHKYENDFNVFHFAASELLDGRDPYQESLHAWTPYLYPPVLAELMMPLAWLPLPAAAYVWFLISLSAAVIAARLSAGLAVRQTSEGAEEASSLPTHGTTSAARLFVEWVTDSSRRRALIALLSAVILLRFILDNFKLGQVNVIITALAVAHVYCYATNRRRWSVAALALAIAIKLTPALLLGYHLAKRRWLFAATSAICAVLLIAASFLPFGVRAAETFNVFFNRTVRNQQGFDLAYGGNQSLRGFVARLSEGMQSAEHPQVSDTASDESVRQPSSALTMVLAAILLLVALAAAAVARSEMAAAAPFFCCMVMLSPLSWKAHFVILILPVAFIIQCALQASTLARKRLLLSVLAAVFALSNLTSKNLFGEGFASWADARSLILLAAFIVYATAVWQAAQQFVKLKRERLSEAGYDHQSAR